jgi:hypothetical protein
LMGENAVGYHQIAIRLLQIGHVSFLNAIRRF